jgi:hypothetical protein
MKTYVYDVVDVGCCCNAFAATASWPLLCGCRSRFLAALGMPAAAAGADADAYVYVVSLLLAAVGRCRFVAALCGCRFRFLAALGMPAAGAGADADVYVYVYVYVVSLLLAAVGRCWWMPLPLPLGGRSCVAAASASWPLLGCQMPLPVPMPMYMFSFFLSRLTAHAVNGGAMCAPPPTSVAVVLYSRIGGNDGSTDNSSRAAENCYI